MSKVIQENGLYVLRDEWTIDDIMYEALNMNLDINAEKAVEIMNLIAHDYDANFGINFDIVQDAIQTICVRNKAL
jgi:hypothetical protein